MTAYRTNTEKHPLEPFVPENARVLMLGSFPPARTRWSMEFFYPNFINDMWRIIGYLFFQDKGHFIASDGSRRFDKDRITAFCTEKGIALYDTACEVRRLKDNASDKFLEVVQTSDIGAILQRMPSCRAIVTTGEKATEIIAGIFGCTAPGVGEMTTFSCGEKQMHFWRMPSSSRAFPMKLETKAGFYRTMFEKENIL